MEILYILRTIDLYLVKKNLSDLNTRLVTIDNND